MDLAYALTIGFRDAKDASTHTIEVHHTGGRMAIIARDWDAASKTTWIPAGPDAAHIAELVAAILGISLLKFEANDDLLGEFVDFDADASLSIGDLADRLRMSDLEATIVATVVDPSVTDLSILDGLEHVELVVCQR
jgi:hypothetical protein